MRSIRKGFRRVIEVMGGGFCARLARDLQNITPSKKGPCLVLGSAPDLVLPAGFDESWTLLSVNASQASIDRRPDCTIMTSAMLGEKQVNLSAQNALRGKSTGRLFLIERACSVSAAEEKLRAIGYHYESMATVGHWQRAKVVLRATGRNMAAGSGKRKVSNGIFAALWASHSGACPVVMSGFSFTRDGHAYDRCGYKREHVSIDKKALELAGRKGLPLYAADSNFARESGLPKWPERWTVACVKWGKKYPADYVNRLRRMVARNFTLPHRFVCLTDDASGLDSGIEIVRLDQGLESCWAKMELFKPGLFGDEDTCLFLDLDVVITGNINDMAVFRPQDRFVGLLDWYRPDGSQYNSSVMKIRGGGNAELNNSLMAKIRAGKLAWNKEFDKYLQANEKVVLWEGRRKYKSDQEWISRYVYPSRELAKHAWPAEWVCSYRKHGQGHVPAGCKVMVFHGFPKPHEVNDAYVREAWV